MVDIRIEYIKSLGFTRDKVDDGWDRYERSVGNQTTYIGHDKTNDEFKMSSKGSFINIFTESANVEEYKLFRRKYIIKSILG